jgi:hypothetical protein
MRVFNESKTKELYYYDLESGFLRNDRLVTKSHPAVPAFEGVGHYESKTYPNGGVEKWWVWDAPPVKAQDAWDEYEEILVYVPFTAEQIKERRIAEIKKRLSQLSEDFVQAWAGAQIADIDARKREFADLHNELRGLLGKEPRVYN